MCMLGPQAQRHTKLHTIYNQKEQQPSHFLALKVEQSSGLAKALTDCQNTLLLGEKILLNDLV